MSDPLSDFLKKPTANQTPMGGTLQCQECNDFVDGGLFDRAEKVLFWYFGDILYKQPTETLNNVLVKMIKFDSKDTSYVRIYFGEAWQQIPNKGEYQLNVQQALDLLNKKYTESETDIKFSLKSNRNLGDSVQINVNN